MTINGPRQSRPTTSYFLARSSHFGIGRTFASAMRTGHRITGSPFYLENQTLDGTVAMVVAKGLI